VGWPLGVNLVPKSKKGWVILLFLNLPSWCAQGHFLYIYYCRSFILWKWKAYISTNTSQDSSVNAVSRLWAWQLWNCPIPSKTFCLQIVQNGSEAHPISYSVATGGSVWGRSACTPPRPPYIFTALRGTALVYSLNKHSHVLLGSTESLVWNLFDRIFLIVFSLSSVFVFVWAFGLMIALLYINVLFTLCNVLNCFLIAKLYK
jgi:hypothetical protein